MNTVRSRLFKLLPVWHSKPVTVALALACLSSAGQTAITPLSFPPSGIGPFMFDTRPGLTNGWSTRVVPGGNGDIFGQAQMDAAVQTNTAAMITNALPEDLNTTAPHTSGGSYAFRWNSARQFIESRPTGTAYAELLLTLQNDSGSDKSAITIEYDFGIDPLPAWAYEAEDADLFGYRVYYSLTGQTGSWVHIPEFDSPAGGGAGNKWASVELVSPWEAGALLYLLWTDDNGVYGSSPGTMATEGPYTIDNLQISPGDPPPPPWGPHSVTVEECRDTNFTVIVFGPASHYQWFKNNLPVGADSPTLAITNAELRDNNSDIFVRISSSFGSVESGHVKLFVTPDTTPPTVDSATAKVNGTNVIVVFSERMDPDLTSGAQAASSYHLSGSDGTTTEPAAAVIAPDGRSVTLTFESARAPNVNYQLLIDPAMGDGCRPLENILSGPINEEGRIIAPLKFEVYLMTFANTHWRYKAGYDDPGVGWRSDPNFDDSSWPEGISVFDGKQETNGFTATPRATVGDMTVTTQLPLRIPEGTSSPNIPSYFFRGHFTLPVPPSEVSALRLRTFIDDFDVAWMNNYDRPVRTNPENPLVNLDTFSYSGGIAVADAGILGPFSIDPTNLVTCDNLVCVKVFQQSAGSSDITFGYELVGVVSHVWVDWSQLSISTSGNIVTITWPCFATLYEAFVPDAKEGEWTAVTGAANGSYNFDAGSAPAMKFYTLRQ